MTDKRSIYEATAAAHQKEMDELHKPKRFITETKAVIDPTGMEMAQINHFLSGRCAPMREGLEKIEFYSFKMDNGSFLFRSSRINLFKDIPPQYKEAVCSLENFIRALKDIGCEIKILDVGWHNVMDMTENIQGNLGFFILNFSIVK